MIPLPSPVSVILLICSLAFVLLSACALAVLSARYHYNYKLLELELSQCRMERSLLEQQHAIAAKTMEARIISLASADEAVHLANLKKSNDALVTLHAQREAACKTLTEAMEELQEICVQQEQKIQGLTELLSTDCLFCGRVAIAASSQAQANDKELQDICGWQEQKIRELTDKLSECHRRLASGSFSSMFSVPLPYPREGYRVAATVPV